MATVDQSGLAGKIRDKPITAELKSILKKAAEVAGVDVVRVTSGGQPGSTGQSTGSTRHNGGRAADLQLVKNGQTQTFTDQDGGPVFETFVTAAAARGAIGIGAGVGYMGNKTIHVGFGLTPADTTKLVWGAGGKSANAPAWLRTAAKAGWDHPVPLNAPVTPIVPHAGRSVVIARDGLRLRSGPGLGFGVITTLASGTELTVLGHDGADDEWARVDLQTDGLADGFVFAAFLAPTNSGDEGDETADEPNGGNA